MPDSQPARRRRWRRWQVLLSGTVGMISLACIVWATVVYQHQLAEQEVVDKELAEALSKWDSYGNGFFAQSKAELDAKLKGGHPFLDVSSLHLTDDLRERLRRVKRVTWLRLCKDTQPADLQWVSQLPGLRGLSLANANMEGWDFSPLQNSPSLQVLDLSGVDISLGDFQTLPKLPQLQALELSRSGATDGHMTHLAQLRLPRLTRLGLSRTHVTDAGLAQICRGYNLTRLDLYRSADITTNTVDEISRMKRLRKLSVGGTALAPDYLWTPELERLHNALPRCSIDCWD